MNSVNIIGFLRENIDDNFRYFEYELPYLEDSSVHALQYTATWMRMKNLLQYLSLKKFKYYIKWEKYYSI